MAHVPNSAEQYEKMIGTPIPQLVSSLAIPTFSQRPERAWRTAPFPT